MFRGFSWPQTTATQITRRLPSLVALVEGQRQHERERRARTYLTGHPDSPAVTRFPTMSSVNGYVSPSLCRVGSRPCLATTAARLSSSRKMMRASLASQTCAAVRAIALRTVGKSTVRSRAALNSAHRFCYSHRGHCMLLLRVRAGEGQNPVGPRLDCRRASGQPVRDTRLGLMPSSETMGVAACRRASRQSTPMSG
jgi:hypothetical protein